MSAYAEQLALNKSMNNKELTPTFASDSDSDAAITMPGFSLDKDVKTAMKAEDDSKVQVYPIATPMTPDKKRAASDYPTPPSTKKIRLTIKCVSKHKPNAADLKSTESKSKRQNKTLRIIVPKHQDTYDFCPKRDIEVLTPESLWEEKRFDLLSPQPVCPVPLQYSSIETKSPHTEQLHDRDSHPDVTADNIKKVLFLHPACTNIRWVGESSERKLAKELEKYERVKTFWLFNDYGRAYCPSRDDKHEIVAREFAEEVQSPWVLVWLAELIGDSDVYLILDHLERMMREELESLEDADDDEDNEDNEEGGEGGKEVDEVGEVDD